LPTVINSEKEMKSTRRPQKAFAASHHQRSTKPWAGTNSQGSKDDQAHLHRRHQHYLGLAESAGNVDRVDRENYLQHAEHFYRMIAEAANARRPTAVAVADAAPVLSVH
jgi:hypothetical protein